MSRKVWPGISMQSLDTFNSRKILDLSDEVLLLILEYLSTRDILNVFRTCQRFQRLCREKKLWEKIEDPPDNKESIQLVCNTFLTSKTTHLQLSSNVHGCNNANRSSFCPSYLDAIKQKSNSCLTHLSLVRQQIDGRIFKLSLFPENLKFLNLSGTHLTCVTEISNYFKGISTTLEKLEELDLSECNWVTSHALLAISKCTNLFRLSLRGCRHIGNSVAYISLASRFGFKTLKILDLNNTGVASTDLISFSGLPNLEELYFGKYDRIAGPLQDEHITDQCVFAVCDSRLIKALDISGTRVTDSIVDFLVGIPNLTMVHAHFTELTEAAIARFRSEMPNCTFHKFLDPPAVENLENGL